ncbi:MAG: YiiX/YebB-like N1pC/P60 family cysteine hydrolase [Elusimicrobiota bacterium]|nr:YiiX/YebB-like N1pC/P60 family cysteine hydrolase [Elusimicrobiota bacterium]
MNKCLITSILILFAQGSFAQNAEYLKSSLKISAIDLESLRDEVEIPLPLALPTEKENSVPANDLEFSKEYVLQQIMAETLEIMKNNGSALMFPVKTIGDARANILTRFFKENYNNSLPNKSNGAGFSGNRFALINVMWALGELGSSASVETIVKSFSSADQTMRLNMMAALSKIKSPQASAALNKIMVAGQSKEINNMEAGDIVYRKGIFSLHDPITKTQFVGHAGIYVGEENGKPMIIESWIRARKITLHEYINKWPFYGNYTTSPKPSVAQRNKIVDYMFSKVGVKHDILHIRQKGPDKFDCVGLAEAAYEAAGLKIPPLINLKPVGAGLLLPLNNMRMFFQILSK